MEHWIVKMLHKGLFDLFSLYSLQLFVVVVCSTYIIKSLPQG